MPEIRSDTNTLLQEYFDKVFVVTVPRFRDRQEKVRRRLEGIGFDFFYGTDKETLTADFISREYHYDKKNSLAVRQYFPPLNPGELACSLSHRMIYQAIVENDWQRVLILEDDVVPDPDNLVLLRDCLAELPPDWELFYLGYLKNENRSAGSRIKQGWYSFMARLGMSHLPLGMIRNRLPRPYSKHLWRAGFHDCTHAYAVSLSGAKKLLAAQSPVTQRADNLLSLLVLQNRIRAFAAKKFLFNQEVFKDSGDRSFIREKWANQ